MSSAVFDTPENPASNLEGETKVTAPDTSKALPIPFFDESSEAKKANINLDIRNAIREAISDRDLFAEVASYLMPEGRTGNRTMDMALACRKILDACDLEDRYSHMNEKLCSEHLVFVLRGRGYVMDKGRLTGHINPALEDKSNG